LVEAARTSLSRGRPEGTDATGRLDLVDRLRAAPDIGASASGALQWLAAHAGIERGLFARVDETERELVGVAGYGVPDSAVPSVRLDCRDYDTPLSWVITGTDLASFDAAELGKRADDMLLGPGPITAAPVFPGNATQAGGLLLLTPADDGGIDEDAVEWAASVLGMRLGQLMQGGDGRPTWGERLKRERAWLYGVIEAVTDPILLTDPEGRILIANRGAEDLFVAEADASEGRRHAVALNNLMFSASLAPLSQLDNARRRELLLVDPVDGSDLLLELISTPLQIRSGEMGKVAILRNVTDLNRAFDELQTNYKKLHKTEAEARGERDRLDLILNSVADPILVTNAEGEVVLMNPPAARILTVGDESDHAAERRVRANDAMLSSFLSNVYTRAKQPWRAELKLTDPESGAELPIEAIGTTYAEASGESAVVTVLHDRSEAAEKARLYEQVFRHSAELEEKVREATAELAEQNELLRRQALELERASAMKSQFLANVSHELRTPLNAMLGYTSLLLESVYGELTPQQHDKLSRVAANANHLTTIITDVLDIAKIEAGKIPVTIEEFRLSDLVEAVLAEFEPLVADSDLEVCVDVSREIPPLRSDPGKVKQIVINLFSNALKFTADGSVSLAARHDETRDLVTIEVVDTGIGISADNQKAVFEAFGHSAHPLTTDKSGAGLGLSISRRLAEVLGGKIELESAPGEGSTFKLTIPRRLPSS
jgi:signal transduction histidine kinase